MAEKRKRPARKKAARKPVDQLGALVEELHPLLLQAYEDLEAEKPILLIDVQERRIYAHDYAKFRAALSPSSQASIREQYEAAQEEDAIVVFVRDNEAEQLVSYTVPRS